MNSSKNKTLTDKLRLAQEIVSSAELRPELQAAAFGEVFRVLGSEENRGMVLDAPDLEPQIGSHRDASDRLALVADALSVDASVVAQVFADDSGELTFVLPTRRLASSTRGAMKQIAILTVCARQAGWGDSWTTADQIRAMCRSVGVYSSKHFNAVLNSLEMFSTNQGRLRAHPDSFRAGREVLVELGLTDAG